MRRSRQRQIKDAQYQAGEPVNRNAFDSRPLLVFTTLSIIKSGTLERSGPAVISINEEASRWNGDSSRGSNCLLPARLQQAARRFTNREMLLVKRSITGFGIFGAGKHYFSLARFKQRRWFEKSSILRSRKSRRRLNRIVSHERMNNRAYITDSSASSVICFRTSAAAD